MTPARVEVTFRERQADRPLPREQEPLNQFDRWFGRCRNTLHFMADLMMDNSEMAERAVQNCRQKASVNTPRFESESEFHGWIFRCLIDEALSIPLGRPPQSFFKRACHAERRPVFSGHESCRAPEERPRDGSFLAAALLGAGPIRRDPLAQSAG